MITAIFIMGFASGLFAGFANSKTKGNNNDKGA
jgi:hypothetical protein